MNKTSLIFLTLVFILAPVFLSAGEPFVTTQGIAYSSDRLIVKMDSANDIPRNPLITRTQHLFANLYVVYTDKLHELEKELKRDIHVVYTERDYYAGKRQMPKETAATLEHLEPSNTPFNDPQLSRQWTFRDAGQNGISVNQAYLEKKNPAKNEVIVAVVDTGVDFNHEDLKDVMWKNPQEIPGNQIDDDNNGYVDDIYGINTLVRDSNGKATSNIKDGHSHGTHVSGTIAATQNNQTGVAGIASKARIMGIRTVPNFGDEKDVDVVESFIYAAKNGARIINCSFGKDHNEGGQAVAEAIDFIGKNHQVLVVAASGNSSRNIDNRPTYPASFTSATLLVVASTTSSGSMSYFSNYGIRSVDVAAPGSSILSCVPNNRYSSMSGTSMASPTVAGVAAEILAYHPNLTAVQLKDIVMEAITPVSGFGSKIATGGRVDLSKALRMAAAMSK